jgi:aldose 1-epimerase
VNSSPTARHGSGAVSPTGTQYEIRRGAFRAAVTEVGAGLRELVVDGRALVRGFDVDQPVHAGRGQLLLPWPNRVGDGRYTVDGETRQLDLSEPATHNAIHGLTRWASWLPVEHGDTHVVLATRLHHQPGYPHVLDLTARYELDDDGLSVAVSTRNVGQGAAPYAVGSHPYLSAGDGPIDDWTIDVPATRRLEVDDRLLPVGLEPVDGTPYDLRGPRRLGDVVLDTAFTGIVRDDAGIARVRMAGPDGSRVELWFGEDLPWLQLYTGDTLKGEEHRRAIAVEPMSAPPNAFANGTDLVWLQPGEQVTHRWGIGVGTPFDKA